jgi:hypothetical protein
MRIEISNWDATYGFNRAKDKRYHWLKMPCDFLLETFDLSNNQRCILLALLLEASKVNSSTFEFSKRVVAPLALQSDEIEAGLIAIEMAGFIKRHSSTLSQTKQDIRTEDKEERRREEKEKRGELVALSGSPICRSDLQPEASISLPHGVVVVSLVGNARPDSTTGEAVNIDPSESFTLSSEKLKDEELFSEQEARLTPEGLRQIWNANRGPLREAKRLGGNRERSARARLKENSDPEFWKAIVTMAATTPFFTGQNDRKWVANFDWLLRESTLNKALEDNYSRQQKPSAEKPYHKLSPQEKNARMLARMRAEEEELAQRRKQEGLDDSPN